MNKLLVFFMLFFMTGCASVTVQKFDQGLAYPKTSPANIVVFPQKPTGRRFTELGEITVRGANNWEQVEKIFRDKAAEMGADAVYVFSKNEEERQYVSTDNNICGGYYYPYHHFGWRGYHPRNYYPRGYYYCYGYQPTIETTTFISAVGISIKYITPIA